MGLIAVAGDRQRGDILSAEPLGGVFACVRRLKFASSGPFADAMARVRFACMEPSWLAALRADVELRDRLTWIDDDDALAASGEDVELPPVDDPEFEAYRPVARGGRDPGDDANDAHDAWLWVDRGAPDRLLLAINEETRPALFIDVGISAAQIRSALDRWATAHAPAPRSARLRLVLGTVPTMRQLENHFVLHGAVESRPLQLATVELPGAPPHEERILLEATFASRYTRSLITLRGWGELVEDERIVIAEVAYAPAPDHQTVRRYNAARDHDYPEDLPLDVILAFDEMPLAWTSARVEKAIATEDPGMPIAYWTLMQGDSPADARPQLEVWREAGASAAPESPAALQGDAADALLEWIAALGI